MSRFIIVFGAICWAGVLVDAIVHLVAGDVLGPVGTRLLPASMPLEVPPVDVHPAGTWYPQHRTLRRSDQDIMKHA